MRIADHLRNCLVWVSIIFAVGGVVACLACEEPEARYREKLDTKTAAFREFRGRVHIRIDRRGYVLEHNCTDPNCTYWIDSVWAEGVERAMKPERPNH
jgi:hypothetical protein